MEITRGLHSLTYRWMQESILIIEAVVKHTEGMERPGCGLQAWYFLRQVTFSYQPASVEPVLKTKLVTLWNSTHKKQQQ